MFNSEAFCAVLERIRATAQPLRARAPTVDARDACALALSRSGARRRAAPTREGRSVLKVGNEIEKINDRYADWSSRRIIEHAAHALFAGKLAFVSSFGAESAVLLHLMAAVDPAIPVLFLDTHKLFGETIRYRSRLQHLLGLEDVRVIGPRKRDVDENDPRGTLSMENPDACCRMRKREPLERALSGFECWATGRKRHQTHERQAMDFLELDGERFKLNPLANWSRGDVAAYFAENNLPEHPLMNEGYLSIGCMPCTSRVTDAKDSRSGRWAGRDKTECGIHSAKENE